MSQVYLFLFSEADIFVILNVRDWTFQPPTFKFYKLEHGQERVVFFIQFKIRQWAKLVPKMYKYEFFTVPHVVKDQSCYAIYIATVISQQEGNVWCAIYTIASKEKLKFYREVKCKKCLKMSDVVMWMGMEQIMEWAYNSPHQSFMNELFLWWQIVNDDDDQTTMWTVTVLGSNSYFYYCHLHLASNRQEIATTSVTKQANLQSTNRSSQKGHFSYKCFHLVSHLTHWIMLWLIF